jgi:AcrR family transcriptional regulator
MPKVIDVEDLFQVTVRVFCERGYAAATTQEIASRAGVNEVTLYRRFGTKAALIGAALWHVLAETPFGRLEGSDDARNDLAGIARAYAETNRAYGDAVVMLLTELPRHPELRSAASALMPNLQRAARIVEAHQERGAIGPGDPFQMVVFLIAPMVVEGLWRRSGIAPQPPAPDPLAVADAFLRGHRPEPAHDDGPAT